MEHNSSETEEEIISEDEIEAKKKKMRDYKRNWRQKNKVKINEKKRNTYAINKLDPNFVINHNNDNKKYYDVSKRRVYNQNFKKKNGLKCHDVEINTFTQTQHPSNFLRSFTTNYQYLISNSLSDINWNLLNVWKKRFAVTQIVSVFGVNLLTKYYNRTIIGSKCQGISKSSKISYLAK